MAHYRSFLLPGAQLHPSIAVLDARESAHLVRVLRARLGSRVELLDGAGQIYQAKVEVADPRAVQLSLVDCHSVAAQNPPIQLVQSIPKGKAMDLILRMATEIGVESIQPVFTSHGEVQLSAARLETKQDKWALQLVEACKQCGLPYRPQLLAPQRFEAAMAAKARSGTVLRLVASLESGSQALYTCLQQAQQVDSIVIAVGPEGDFSAEEYAQLRSAGFQPVRLGQQVLRAETAVAYLLSAVDQWRQSLQT
jgi:16S rRNA (uracil1498-N3)-methyltransferase